MRVVVQRVQESSVHVVEQSGRRAAGAIGPGILALVGFTAGDGEEPLSWMAGKIADLRIFPGAAGTMDRSLRETGGGLLLVSQFTLYADTRKGRRPDFTAAAPYAEAERLFARFREACEAELPGRVATGLFGARMEVALINDGPVTLVIDR
ncbi:MAG TPA: D-aminoacyl-tRNA deacylase [Gemmatimonadota bacterium]|nr:D-aminoacyl-tRNA deacylase [Gemmatimonadota bacterium]